jgi:hypothetical protein
MVASAYESFFSAYDRARRDRAATYAIGPHRSAIIEFSDARDLATGLEEDVALSELRGRAVLADAVRADQHLETFRISSGEAELVAAGREEILQSH